MIEKKKRLEELTSEEREEYNNHLRVIRKEHSQRMSRHLSETGVLLNPSLNALCQHSDLFDLTTQAKEQLRRGSEQHEIMYQQMIIPYLPDIVRAITRDRTIDFDTNKPERACVESVRKFLRRSYLDTSLHNQTRKNKSAIDDITLNTLNSTNPLPTSNYGLKNVKYFSLLKQGMLVSYRPKYVARLSSKQQEKVQEVVDAGLIEQLYEFIEEGVCSPQPMWRTDIYTQIVSKYKVLETVDPHTKKESFITPITDAAVGDNLGVRVLVADAQRARRIQESILRGSASLGQQGFGIVPGKIEDHRQRRYDEQKPGGVHLTVITKGPLALPFEMQVYSVVDEILDKFGPFSHHRYEKKRE